jgi:MFS family permease
MKLQKPSVSFWQIFNMNIGFLGIQYSFDLQQTAINPIFLYLGAPKDILPILNIAGPVTGLVVQPVIGELYDKTWSNRWRRRKPYFLIGALLGNLTYNIVTMVVALALVPVTLRFGGKKEYALSLVGTAITLFTIPYISDPLLVVAPVVLFGIGWAAMMGIPYTTVSKIVLQDKRGVYMGILNMMIVIPMGTQTLTFGPIYKYLLDRNAINAMLFAGIFFAIAAFLAMQLNEKTKG